MCPPLSTATENLFPSGSALAQIPYIHEQTRVGKLNEVGPGPTISVVRFNEVERRAL